MSNPTALRKLTAEMTRIARITPVAEADRQFDLLTARTMPANQPILRGVDFEAALGLLPDTAMRERWVRRIYRQMDISMDVANVRSGQLQYIVAVPFHFAGEAPSFLFEADPRRRLLEGSPELHLQPPPGDLSIPTYLAVEPVLGVSFAEILGMPWLLTDPEYRRGPQVQEYALGRWQIAFNAKLSGHLFAYYFMVSTGTAVAEMEGELPDSDFLRAKVAAIAGHIARLNAEFPQARITLQPACRLSEAIVRSGDLVFRNMMSIAVPRPHEQPPSTVVLAMQVAKDHRGVQCAHVLAFDGEDRLLDYAVEGCPPGTPLEQLRATCRAALDDMALPRPVELIAHPALIVPNAEDADGVSMVRDRHGNPCSLGWLALGEAKALFKQAHWLQGTPELVRQMITGTGQFPAGAAGKPLPQMLAGLDLQPMVRGHYRDDVAAAVLALARTPGMSHVSAMHKLVTAYPALQQTPFTALLPPQVIFGALHFAEVGGAVLQVNAALSRRMLQTDIDRSVAVRWLHAPFADCYVHFVEPVPIKPLRAGAPPREVQGFFITDRVHELAENVAAGAPPETREFTAVPVTGSAGVPVLEPGLPLIVNVAPEDESAFPVYVDALLDQFVARVPDTGTVDHFRSYREAFLLLFKVLLYCNMPSARKVAHQPRTQLRSQAAAASGKQRQHLYARAAQVIDYIEVGPEADDDEPATAGAGSGRSVRPHARRGYIRSQAYGPQWSLHRPTWIPPTFVNFDGPAGSKPAVVGHAYNVS